MNTFLFYEVRCQVSISECMKYFYLKEKCFKDIEILDNVNYLNINLENCDANESFINRKKDIINLLIERDLSIPIQYNKQLLWKLTFIKFDKDCQNCENEFSYDALFTIHHQV